jgi:hypothetical protein
VADDGIRPAEEPFGGRKVALGDGGTDLGAADRLAVERELRGDDDIEAELAAQRGDGLRRAPTLVAEGGVGRHQEAGEVDAVRDAADERVVWRLAQGRSKCCTTVTCDARPPRGARAGRPDRTGAAAPGR